MVRCSRWAFVGMSLRFGRSGAPCGGSLKNSQRNRRLDANCEVCRSWPRQGATPCPQVVARLVRGDAVGVGGWLPPMGYPRFCPMRWRGDGSSGASGGGSDGKVSWQCWSVAGDTSAATIMRSEGVIATSVGVVAGCDCKVLPWEPPGDGKIAGIRLRPKPL